MIDGDMEGIYSETCVKDKVYPLFQPGVSFQEIPKLAS